MQAAPSLVRIQAELPETSSFNAIFLSQSTSSLCAVTMPCLELLRSSIAYVILFEVAYRAHVSRSAHCQSSINLQQQSPQDDTTLKNAFHAVQCFAIHATDPRSAQGP
jgi:hypothetical protein